MSSYPQLNPQMAEIQRKTLEFMAHRVREINVANGWHDEDRTIGDGIALLHSEVSEMFEAYRDGGLADQTDSELIDAHADTDYLPKPEGYGSEAADVLIRLLDECDRRGVDLHFEFERKLAYNATRGHKHGGKLL